MAVYSAGYVRTKDAADRFDDEDARRRPPMRSDGPEIAITPAPVNLNPGPAQPAVESRAEAKPLPARDTAKPPTAVPAARAPTKQQPAVDSSIAAAASPTADSSTVAVPPTAPAAPATNSAPPAADTVAHPTEHAPQWRDGAYSGWGTSRHGDIQAAVEIKDGRITSAFITQCLTRYSCSWISALPPQVVGRQSADVDYVSGATQSTNAFYYAILEALNKAK